MLPTSLEAAASRMMHQHSIAREPEVFGNDFVDHYGGTREHEVKLWNEAVTNWEGAFFFDKLWVETRHNEHTQLNATWNLLETNVRSGQGIWAELSANIDGIYSTDFKRYLTEYLQPNSCFLNGTTSRKPEHPILIKLSMAMREEKSRRTPATFLAIVLSTMKLGMLPPGEPEVAIFHSKLPLSSSMTLSTLTYRP